MDNTELEKQDEPVSENYWADKFENLALSMSLQHLPNNQQRIINLIYMQDHTLIETATVMNTSVYVVRRELSSALKELHLHMR